jgi:hypothetical protein
MNAAFGSRAFFLFRRRRFRILTMRLRRHVQKSPHDAFHPLRDLLLRILIVLAHGSPQYATQTKETQSQAAWQVHILRARWPE